MILEAPLHDFFYLVYIHTCSVYGVHFCAITVVVCGARLPHGFTSAQTCLNSLPPKRRSYTTFFSSILQQLHLHRMCFAHVLTQYVNNTRTSHNFKFDGVLGEKATQVTTHDQASGGTCSSDTRLSTGLVSSRSKSARRHAILCLRWFSS